MPVVFEAHSLGRRFELQLRPSPALLDPHFVLLKRWSNRTVMLSPDLAEQSCFYRSDADHRAAVALCGGMVRPQVIIPELRSSLSILLGTTLKKGWRIGCLI